jgi:hypothetical protein
MISMDDLAVATAAGQSVRETKENPPGALPRLAGSITR